MPVLGNTSDEQISKFMQKFSSLVIERITAGPLTDEIRVVSEMMRVALETSSEPEFSGPRISNYRRTDAMVPDGMMTPQDLLLMSTGIGNKTVKRMLDVQPDLAAACGYNALAEYDEEFPYTRLAARGFARLDKDRAAAFVADFRREFSHGMQSSIDQEVETIKSGIKSSFESIFQSSKDELSGPRPMNAEQLATFMAEILKDPETAPMLLEPIREKTRTMLCEGTRRVQAIEREIGLLPPENYAYPGLPQI